MHPSIILRLRTRHKPSASLEHGFGLVETIVSSAILGTVLVLSMSLISSLDKTRYNSSLRDATRTIIDEDIESLKQHLFSVHYISSSSSKCFKTNSECSSTFSPTQLAQICKNYALYSAQTAPGGMRSLITKNNSISSVFRGNPFDIQRVITTHKPHLSNGTIYHASADNSIIRLTFTLTSSTSSKVGLSADSSGETLRVVDLYPDAHPYCNPE